MRTVITLMTLLTTGAALSEAGTNRLTRLGTVWEGPFGIAFDSLPRTGMTGQPLSGDFLIEFIPEDASIERAWV